MKYITLFFSTISLCLNSFAQREAFPSNMLSQSTVRIEGYSDTIIGGQKRWFTHTGTGFFYEFEIDSIKFPVIVTNRHVVEKSKNGKFAFRFVDSTYKLGQRIRSGTLEIMSFNKSWIYHPTEDLAILPLGPIKEHFLKSIKRRYLVFHL